MSQQAMLLGAGFGTRLWPLTADRAKPAVPFLGVPLVRRLAEQLLAAGFEPVVVNTHHRPHSVRDAVDGLNVRISHEHEILGTAGGIAQARDRRLLEPDRPCLIVNAKLFTEVDFRAACEAHDRHGAEVTMVLRPNPLREAFREVFVAEGRVTGFGAGRTPETPNPLAFTGIQVLSPRVLAALEARFSDTVRHVFPPLIAARAIRAHTDPARWWEFSTIERYVALHAEAERAGLTAGPPARHAFIHPRADVRRTVCFEGAHVEAGAVVEDAVLGAWVTIRRGERVRRAAVVRRDRVERLERGVRWGERVRVDLRRTP